MKKVIFNFLKADLRMPQLMFWDWCFPVILIIVLGIFIGDSAISEFLLPGFISLFLMQSIVFSIPYRLAQYNESGLMRFIKEKGSVMQLILSFFLSRIFILVLQTFIVILVGKIMMKVNLDIHWGFMLISFIYTVSIFMLISSLLGLKIKTQNAALGLSQAIYFVLMGISGIFYPLEKSPDLLRKLSVVSPLKYISKIWESAIYGIRIFQIQDVLILSAMIVILGIFLLYISRSGKRGDGYESCPSD